jgi:ABC-type oligopeptide transport system substrate-binding subunit
MWGNAIGSYTDGLGDIKITVNETFPDSDLLYSLTDAWRESFGANFLIEIVSEEEFELKKSDRNYDIILTEISSENFSPESFFNIFIYDNNYGFSYDASIAANLENAAISGSVNELSKSIANAETIAISSGKIIPLFYGYEYCIVNENSDGIKYIPFTKELILQKAKMY